MPADTVKARPFTPKAKWAYAWSFDDGDGNPRYIAVLELPPIESPNTAVRPAVASGQQK